MNLISSVRNSTVVNTLRQGIPNSAINTLKHLPTGLVANLIYGFPSRDLTIIGVTGTDGKTTTASMLYHILHQNGFKVALISTVSAKIGSEEIDTGFHVTSPDHFPLQKLLKKIRDKGFSYVVLEVTSHGLAQHRFLGVKFTGGIVTNITKDHLDYHKTWENYALAKAKLFQDTSFAILNHEDKSFAFLKTRAKGKLVTYGEKLGDWNRNSFLISLRVLGDFNYLNALAASAAAYELEVSKLKIAKALTSFTGVKGRMQVMQSKPFMIVVDFAHTPNALLTALKSIRKVSDGRIISIFGCAGMRDRNRREMGKVSAQNADITVITAEDPREEGVEKISKEIAQWAVKGGAKEVSKSALLQNRSSKTPVFVCIPDRQEAINFGVSIAKKGDLVGIFGKGHEQSMCFGTVETPWSDQEAVKKALLLRK